ncbi:AMP-binding protein [Croceibacterium aestuarii]|uniref:AMP-binding protein n=1 Tax=Croceibacterium aestuarii TaxID=3064139 RepID=UPI00272E1393|nr:AMP-binding protein [Croceibacterium sp. D39]
MSGKLERALANSFEGHAVRDVTIGDLLREAAAAWSEREGLIEGKAEGTAGRRWTFAEMLDDAERIAGSLAGRYRPGERIAIWAPNMPEWVLLEYAAALAGLALVTVNPAYQARELDYVLRQSRSVALFLVREHRGNLMREIAEQVATEIPALREIVDIEDQQALFGRGSSASLPEVGTNEPAQIQYTSGTTGFPKGVVLSHRNLANNARMFSIMGKLEEGSKMIGLTPLFHTMGCSMGVLGTVQLGAAYVPLRVFDPDAALDLIESERIGWTLCVPTMAQALVEAQRRKPRDLSHFAYLGAGGAMVPPELVRAIKQVIGADIRVAYGQTESSPLITACRREDDFEDVCSTIGRPSLECEVGIFDPATGEILPCDTVGEIRCRSYATMIGYNDNPQATAEAVDAQGWLHTGDLGTMDNRGFVRITGRVKEMIIRGGENLFPAEIENVLLEHPDVAEAAVVGVPCPRLGEAVAAFVRLEDGAALDVEALRQHCRSQISPQKCPAHWQAVESWPLTGSGKIKKFELRDRWLAENA